MKVIQVKLKRRNTEITTWVDFDKRIKRGVKISLKNDEGGLYEVADVYGTTDSKNLHVDWNAGGLVTNSSGIS